MSSAEIITIGTELLLGEIQDTNTRYLARQLRDIGVEIYRTTTIGDNALRIATVIQDSFTRVEIVITTGGLGPTVDDPTRDAAALSFNTHTEFHLELWKGIEERFLKRGIVPPQNNRRQAYLPFGAQVIPNPVGTAPAFYYEFGDKVLICLPGVPLEMETLTQIAVLPYLKKKFNLNGIIKARVLHLSGIGESTVDDLIGELEKLPNPTVGLLAHPGIVDIRITAKADSDAEADAMIAKVENVIRFSCEHDIFGVDDDTLSKSVNNLAIKNDLKVVIYSSGLQGLWPAEVFSSSETAIEIIESVEEKPAIPHSTKKENYLEVKLIYFQEDLDCHIDLDLSIKSQFWHESSIYNGPPAQGPIWAINHVLDTIRRTIIKTKG